MSKPSSECLNLLVNKRLSKLGHAANMLWISFGQDIKVTDYRGKQKCVGEYALHIQCPWRITRKQDVLLSSRDMISLRENDSANSLFRHALIPFTFHDINFIHLSPIFINYIYIVLHLLKNSKLHNNINFSSHTKRTLFLEFL